MKRIMLLLAASFILVNLKAQTPDYAAKMRTINVNGHAETEITPDEVYVMIELREYTKKNGDKIDIQTINNKFLSAAKSMGIADSDVVVQNYSGWNGNYWIYQKNKKQNPDLKAGITYEVKLKSVNDMNNLVSKLDDEGTQNFFISRTSHSKIDSIKKEMKAQAIRNAKEEAVFLAGVLNETVGDAITINSPNESNNYPRPMYRAALADEAVAAAPPAMDVDFKKIKVAMDINVVFELK